MTSDEDEVMDTTAAAQLLGVGKRTITEAARDGKLPGRRIGRAWRFSRRALLEWLAAR